MGELESLESVVLWEHENKESTFMWEFMQRINETHKKDLKTYDELHEWSIQNVADFWGEVWDFTGMQAEQPYKQVSGAFPFASNSFQFDFAIGVHSLNIKRVRDWFLSWSCHVLSFYIYCKVYTKRA